MYSAVVKYIKSLLRSTPEKWSPQTPSMNTGMNTVFLAVNTRTFKQSNENYVVQTNRLFSSLRTQVGEQQASS